MQTRADEGDSVEGLVLGRRRVCNGLQAAEKAYVYLAHSDRRADNDEPRAV